MRRAVACPVLVALIIALASARAEEISVEVSSAAFPDGGAIPKRYSFGDRNISPPLSWSGLPAGTESVALLCDDPDAPAGTWTHWIVYNISPQSPGLPEDVPDDRMLAGGAVQGINDFGAIGWDGPSPPQGTHRYIFRVYALDTMLDPGVSMRRGDLQDAMRGHVLGQGRLTGTFSKE